MYKSGSGKIYSEIINALFALDQMDHPVNQDFKTIFINKNPLTTVLTWLNELEQQNLKYKHLSAQIQKGARLPIKLIPGTAVTMYHQMVRIQQLLKQDKVTHQDLLNALYPSVAFYYQNLRANYVHVNDRVIALYNDRSNLQLSEQLKYNPRLGIKTISTMSMLTPDKYEKVFKQEISAARSECLSGVELTEKNISSASEIKAFTHVTFKSLSTITDPFKQFLKSNTKLKQIALIECDFAVYRALKDCYTKSVLVNTMMGQVDISRQNLDLAMMIEKRVIDTRLWQHFKNQPINDDQIQTICETGQLIAYQQMVWQSNADQIDSGCQKHTEHLNFAIESQQWSLAHWLISQGVISQNSSQLSDKISSFEKIDWAKDSLTNILIAIDQDNVNLNKVDQNGDTLLHTTAREYEQVNQQIDTLKESNSKDPKLQSLATNRESLKKKMQQLLNAGINETIVNQDGYTALGISNTCYTLGTEANHALTQPMLGQNGYLTLKVLKRMSQTRLKLNRDDLLEQTPQPEVQSYLINQGAQFKGEVKVKQHATITKLAYYCIPIQAVDLKAGVTLEQRSKKEQIELMLVLFSVDPARYHQLYKTDIFSLSTFSSEQQLKLLTHSTFNKQTKDSQNPTKTIELFLTLLSQSTLTPPHLNQLLTSLASRQQTQCFEATLQKYPDAPMYDEKHQHRYLQVPTCYRKPKDQAQPTIDYPKWIKDLKKEGHWSLTPKEAIEGIDLNRCDADGNTALYKLVAHATCSLIKEFLTGFDQVDLNKTERADGLNPLKLAIESNQLEVVKLLLD
ncbi:ankyrin repeat domain-containing protein, partial [Gammaproteobacteria bacterium]|nr:ankyrin repeat domain-containing protein [Gammaproteobacteria bacterium]